MLDHPIRGGFAEALCIFVYDRLLVVVCFCIVDEPFTVALDLGQAGVFSVEQFFLRSLVSAIGCALYNVRTATRGMRW